VLGASCHHCCLVLLFKLLEALVALPVVHAYGFCCSIFLFPLLRRLWAAAWTATSHTW
jgi:hypothetical protein